ncbi:hypothetical protein PSHT_12143 [Puccinia striiformis]|uniref:Uncharacterized protein n=1 Tax=Puccinia striiformis TaxID=27350 RepID=A0A2S4UYI4_9BASI|nr:hypothetical protein PSHT_12143 [Puccinia striiformis]
MAYLFFINLKINSQAISFNVFSDCINPITPMRRCSAAKQLGLDSLFYGQPRRSSARYPPPSTRHTFETDEYSMLPRGYAINQGQQGVVENEAPLERLRRLRFEVDQLEEELEHKQVPASSSRATASSPTARECPISYHAHTK